MAKKSSKTTAIPLSIPQDYPRIHDSNSKEYGCLDVSALVSHPEPRLITAEALKSLILAAISDAEGKSSRSPSIVPIGLTEEEEEAFYAKEGRGLFEYFHDYPSDPAGTAHDYHGKNYRNVGTELYRDRTLQKGRMNSGWRYQFLAAECAEHSGRFHKVSGIGSAKGDFNAVIDFLDKAKKPLHLYVSVKNRSDTLGGQDWPNSIIALEAYAKGDNNRTGPYCCVFGIAMDRGQRRIPRKRETGEAHSHNTEVWLSDFFWSFFSGYSYQDIMIAMLQALVETVHTVEELPTQIDVPERILDYFGGECLRTGLIDELGNFHDPFALVRFFCQKTPTKLKKDKKA